MEVFTFCFLDVNQIMFFTLNVILLRKTRRCRTCQANKEIRSQSLKSQTFWLFSVFCSTVHDMESQEPQTTKVKEGHLHVNFCQRRQFLVSHYLTCYCQGN